MNVVDKLVGLIRETSSSLPEDVIKALKAAQRKEKKGSSAAVVLKTILDNCAIAAKRGTPLCQDTGTLTFFVDERLRRKVTESVIKKAVAIATGKGYLRKNTIDSITGKSFDDNCAPGAPVIHYVSAPSSLVPRPSSLLASKGRAVSSRRVVRSPWKAGIMKGFTGGSCFAACWAMKLCMSCMCREMSSGSSPL